MSVRLVKLIRTQTAILFPHWVEGPTPCKTRTFSTVVEPNADKAAVIPALRHGAVRLIMTFDNMPMMLIRVRGTGKLLYIWEHRMDEHSSDRYEIITPTSRKLKAVK